MEREGPVNLSTSKVISDTFFVSASRIGVSLLKPVRGILLARLLGPSLYGILSIPFSYSNILTNLSNIGFTTAAIKLIPGYRQEGREDLAHLIYRSSIFLTVVLSTLWSILLFLFSRKLALDYAHEPAAVNPIRIYSLMVPFLAVNQFYAIAFLAVQRGKLRAAITFIYGVLNVLFPIVMVLFRHDVVLVIGGFLAAEVIGAVLFASIFHARALRPVRTDRLPLSRGIMEVFGFGFLFFIANMGWNMINSVDRIMIQHFLPAEQLGFYAQAVLVVSVLGIVASTSGTALVPSLSAARHAGDGATFKRQINNTARLIFMALIPASAMIFLLSGDLFELILSRYISAVGAIKILVFIGFVDILCRTGWAALVAYGKGGMASGAYIFALFLNIILNYFFIPRFGIKGAAAATLSSFLILAAVLQSMMWVVSRTRVRLTSLFHPLALSLVYPALGSVFPTLPGPARLILIPSIGTILYIILAALTGLVRRGDIAAASVRLRERPGSLPVRFALSALAQLDRIAPRGK